MRMLIGGVCFLAATFMVGAAEEKPDTGFTLLFNGKDLTGWKVDWTKQKKEKKDNESLDGKTEAVGGRFKAADGVLTIDPKVKGDIYIESTKTFDKDVTIKFEYNPGQGCNNDMFIRGIKFDIKADLKTTDIKNIKVGEWNQFEIVVKGGDVDFRNNGESMKTFKAKPGATPFTIRAEAGPCQYRKLQYKE